MARVKTADLNAYMRNYMRVRHGYLPRAELYALKFTEFRRIILAGQYGTISAVSKQIGVTRMTGWLWLRKVLAEKRQARAGGAA